MPVRAKSPCRHSSCNVLVDKPGYCDIHRKETYKVQKQTVTEDYKERNRFYQRAVWKRVRAAHLQLEPLCRNCRKYGRLRPAEVVDHIIPIANGGADLDHGNLQSLCKPCHNAKTRSDTTPGAG